MCSDHVRICGKYDGVYYGSLLVQMAIQQDTIDVFKLQKNKQGSLLVLIFKSLLTRLF